MSHPHTPMNYPSSVGRSNLPILVPPVVRAAVYGHDDGYTLSMRLPNRDVVEVRLPDDPAAVARMASALAEAAADMIGRQDDAAEADL